MTKFRESSAAETDHAPSPAGSKNIAVLRYLIPYLRANVPLIALAILAILAAAAAVLAFGQGLRGIVDHGLAGNDTASLDRAFVIMIGIIAMLAGASMLRMYSVTAIGERVVASLRTDLFNHLLTLTPGFFESAKVGEILSRLTNDAAQIQTVVGTSFPIALRNSILLVGAGVMLAITSVKLTALVALVVPLVVAPMVWIGRRVRKLSRLAQDRVSDISGYGAEVLSHIKIAQAFTHEPIDRAEFQARADAALAAAIDRTRLRAVLSAMMIGLVFTAIAIVLWIGGYDVLSGRMSGGALASFVFYAIVAAGSVAALSEVAGDMQRAAGSLERIFELLLTEPLIPIAQNPRAIPDAAADGDYMIHFDAVDFHYPTRPDQKSLCNFNLRVREGETIGIVGASGAGKTTIFQLLLRFYDPTAGRILWNGVNIADVDPADLRRKIGYVGQDAAIFSASLADNIRYGRPDANDDDLRRAITDAKVDEFLPHLPDGLNSRLGERGVLLSGGQRQRIAIARAMLCNPPLLLLDEATSQLDSDNENFVQAALEKLSKGRTTLLIAHRLSTLRHAGRILVLDAGRMVGEGSHDRLLEDSPLFRHWVGLQAA